MLYQTQLKVGSKEVHALPNTCFSLIDFYGMKHITKTHLKSTVLGPSYLPSTTEESTTQVAGYFNAFLEQTAIYITLHTYSCLVNLSYFHWDHAFPKASSYSPSQ